MSALAVGPSPGTTVSDMGGQFYNSVILLSEQQNDRNALGSGADPEYRGAAVAASAARGRAPVLHGDLLRVLDVPALSALHAVSGH